jgi:DNA-binding transcriptional MerR regulator
MNTDYSISDLSKEFDVTPRTLRYYEEKGILAPLRKGQSRIYSTADRAHLILILRGKQLGLSLEESADLISMYDPSTNNKRQLEVLIDKIRAQRLHLQQQKEELERMIVDLEAWEQRSILATQAPRHTSKSKNKASNPPNLSNRRELT